MSETMLRVKICCQGKRQHCIQPIREELHERPNPLKWEQQEWFLPSSFWYFSQIFFSIVFSHVLSGLFLCFDLGHEYLCALWCEHQRRGSGLTLCISSWRRDCICASWFQVCKLSGQKHLTTCNSLMVSTEKRLWLPMTLIQLSSNKGIKTYEF